MRKLLFIYCFPLVSCYSQKLLDNNISTTISKTDCGSYEVKSANKVLGFVVQPFYTKFANMEQGLAKNTASFENLLSDNYSSYYDNSLRVYFFTINRGNDTIMDVLMLTKTQASLVKNWQCQFLNIDSYKTKHRHRTSKRHPAAFIFNCNKKRFKTADDPE